MGFQCVSVQMWSWSYTPCIPNAPWADLQVLFLGMIFGNSWILVPKPHLKLHIKISGIIDPGLICKTITRTTPLPWARPVLNHSVGLSKTTNSKSPNHQVHNMKINLGLMDLQKTLQSSRKHALQHEHHLGWF